MKKVLVASGVRYDLAATSPEYVRELATHHVGGYLKIAPEHTEDGPLAMMLKPGIGAYEKFRALFDRYSREAGKKQYLIPYFIAAHPGTTDQDMVQLALWLKRNGFSADQVQAFLPSPMATATAMYHTGLNPLRRLRRRDPERVHIPKGLQGAPPAQGLPALPRSRQLAPAARGPAPHGPRRPDRQPAPTSWSRPKARSARPPPGAPARASAPSTAAAAGAADGRPAQAAPAARRRSSLTATASSTPKPTRATVPQTALNIDLEHRQHDDGHQQQGRQLVPLAQSGRGPAAAARRPARWRMRAAEQVVDQQRPTRPSFTNSQVACR